MTMEQIYIKLYCSYLQYLKTPTWHLPFVYQIIKFDGPDKWLPGSTFFYKNESNHQVTYELEK